jgi:eukaryotic-like serine/threonine-protein kinase
MGVVYAAYDPELDRRVAVKLLHPGGDGETGRARLLREAQTMARLTHPNVVTVHDAGTIDDQVFVAMELLDGETLKQWMHAKARPWREVLATLLPAGRGLAAAHAADLVHRDFKPDNVMIARDGRVVVMDFGLARPSVADETPTETPREVRRAPVGSLTETGAILGTPAYMAPEQHLGREAGPAADQFAYAVTLYEALQGQRPFLPAPDDDVSPSMALGAEIVAGRIRPGPRDGELPPRLRRAVVRGLADDPAARWPSMQAMLDELEAVARPRRWSIGVAAAGVVVAGGAVAFAATRGGGTAAAPSPCLGADARLVGVWDDAAHARVAQAFRSSGAAVAEHSVASVTRTLDEYFAAWVAQRTSACEDTRHGQQSDELLDRRMLCLDTRFAEARALVDIFAHADVTVVNQSVREPVGPRRQRALAARRLRRSRRPRCAGSAAERSGRARRGRSRE